MPVGKSSFGRAFQYKKTPVLISNLEHYDLSYAKRTPEKNKRIEEAELRSEIPNLLLTILEDFEKRTGKKKQDIKILELGCGNGIYSFQLLKQGYDAWATDYSKECVEKVLKPILVSRGYEPERAFVLDASKIGPKFKAQFDICFIVGLTYEHQDFQFMEKVYSQVYKCLKNPGIFVHALNTYENGYLKLKNFLVGKNRIKLIPGIHYFEYWYYRHEDLKKAFQNTGFRVLGERYLDLTSGIVEYLPICRSRQNPKNRRLIYDLPPNFLGNIAKLLCTKNPQWLSKRSAVWGIKSES